MSQKNPPLFSALGRTDGEAKKSSHEHSTQCQHLTFIQPQGSKCEHCHPCFPDENTEAQRTSPCSWGWFSGWAHNSMAQSLIATALAVNHSGKYGALCRGFHKARDPHLLQIFRLSKSILAHVWGGRGGAGNTLHTEKRRKNVALLCNKMGVSTHG